MSRLWKVVRWGAFAFSAIVDGIIFYSAAPFSALSFIASGSAALVLYLIFLELSLQARNQWRIRRALVENEKVVYQTGLHWIVLLRNVLNDRVARWCIGLPILLAVLVVFYELGWAAWLGILRSGFGSYFSWFPSFIYGSLPNDGVIMAGCIPLLLAIPFTMTQVVDWGTHRFVITNDRVMILSGIFNYDVESISLERVVDTELHLSFWDQLLRYGDVLLRMTAGGEQKPLNDLRDPITFDKRLRQRISSHGREPAVSE